MESGVEPIKVKKLEEPQWWKRIGQGLKEDVNRRFPYYLSDYTDGLKGKNTLHKVFAITLFLYFSILLPVIATGALNALFTNGQIGVYQLLMSEIIGGLAWTFLAGQPLVIISNSMVVAVYNKVIYDLAQNIEVDFLSLYACTGLWSSLFLILYAFFNLSNIIKNLKRSIKEIYTCFVVLAFIKGAIGNTEKDFNERTREETLFSILLMLATYWLALKLLQIKSTHFFNGQIRELIASYAVPVAIIFTSLVSNLVFQDMTLSTFEYNPDTRTNFNFIDFTKLNLTSILVSAGLGFCLSIVFFMSQSVTMAMVDCPEHNLQKGSAYHWDLVVLALINGTMGMFGIPFLHAIIPHSPLQAKGLADTIQTEDGRIVITRVRETRIVNLLLHLLFAISLLFLPYVLPYCPISVLSGLFLYLAYNALNSTQFYGRIKLFISEKVAFPQYATEVPTKVLHAFTFLQIIQVAILSFFGFAPWPQVRMFFPLIVFLFFLFRQKVWPRIFKLEHLNVLDQ